MFIFGSRIESTNDTYTCLLYSYIYSLHINRKPTPNKKYYHCTRISRLYYYIRYIIFGGQIAAASLFFTFIYIHTKAMDLSSSNTNLSNVCKKKYFDSFALYSPCRHLHKKKKMNFEVCRSRGVLCINTKRHQSRGKLLITFFFFFFIFCSSNAIQRFSLQKRV